jgi:hypothetical protein
MKTFKDYLVEAEYKTTAGDDWIPLTREEALRRFKQFGFTNHGKTITWQDADGGEWSYEHACHEALVNPTFEFGRGLDERDPQAIQRVIDMYKNTPERGIPGQADYEIANKTTMKEDAVQYQKIKDQLPPPPDEEETKGKTTYASSMGDRVGKMLGSVTKGAVDAVSSGIDSFKSAFRGNKNKTADAQGPKLDIVKDLQNLILARDPDALPKYGADGRMGPETRAAMKRLGIN